MTFAYDPEKSVDETLDSLVALAKQNDAFVDQILHAILLDGTILSHKREWEMEDNFAFTEHLVAMAGEWLTANDIPIETRVHILIEYAGVERVDLCEEHGRFEGLGAVEGCEECDWQAEEDLDEAEEGE